MKNMPSEDYIFYKNLYNVVNEPNIMGLLNKYVEKQLEISLSSLKHAKELIEIGRFQGQIEAYEKLLGLKNTLMNIIRSGN